MCEGGDRFRAAGGPHPTRLTPAHLPPGEGFGWYHISWKGTTYQVYAALTEPSPGGKVAAKQTDEGYVPQAVRCVLTHPPKI